MRKPPKNPVLPEHRVVFESYLKLWAGRFGLQSWRVRFSPKRPTRGNAAEAVMYWDDRVAEIRLADDLGTAAPTPENLEAFAVHELLHVLLGPIIYHADSGIEEAALPSAEHERIHILQKLLTKGSI